MTRALVGVALALLAVGPGAAAAQAPKPAPVERPPAPRPEHTRELDCRNCHQGTHRGVVQMYLGLGGRGAPTIPSHMLQVRVECVACHVVPEPDPRGEALVGQTFRPSERACVSCHGEKYRGMLARWAATLGRMRQIVGGKLAATRAGLASADATPPKLAKARELLGDADFNVRFVAFAKGVHNVFYAADLLKLSNGWADEATLLLGKPRIKTDDALVRGGYCAVLCHEQAGVRQRETVTFGTQKIPHVRHVTEFGAVCTACHSAEVHKAVTAKPATCTGCHHHPENERCESCHRAQSAFYRGTVKRNGATIEPNVMASAVPCTGCHDWSVKHSRQAVGQKCVGCHDASYRAFVGEWTTGLDKATAKTAETVTRAEGVVARERRAGRATAGAADLVAQARAAVATVRTARPVHNPGAAEALLEEARKKAEQAAAR